MSWIDELRGVLARARDASPAPSGEGACDCREAVEVVFEWLDGELDPAEAKRIEAHLLRCARCHPMVRFEHSFQEALRRTAAAPCAPKELGDQVLQALRARGFQSE